MSFSSEASEDTLERASDVLALVLFGSISTAVAATVGTTALLGAGEIPGSNYGFAWQLWWLGDTMGALLVAPFLLAWGRVSDLRRERRDLLEATILLGLVVLSGWLVFFGGRWRYPYLLFPLIVWVHERERLVPARRTSWVGVHSDVAYSGDRVARSCLLRPF